MWSIGLITNDVVITDACAKALFKAQAYPEELWSEVGDVTHDGRLSFNGDHMEHMDFLGSNDAMVAVLCAHKVSGDICFGSLEGDNAGSFWGYRFDGKGGMTPLAGEVVFKEVEQALKGMTVVVTGRLAACTREEAHARILQAGGKASDTVSAKTDFVVVGADPGAKAAKARKLGVKVLDEQTFLAMVGATG